MSEGYHIIYHKNHPDLAPHQAASREKIERGEKRMKGKTMKKLLLVIFMAVMLILLATAESFAEKIEDITMIDGINNNTLLGEGLVLVVPALEPDHVDAGTLK